MTDLLEPGATRIVHPSAATSVLKRAFDVAGAAAGLLLIAPLLAITALAIRLDTPGPVLFVQDRHGLGGRIFCIYKFRTMTAAASREAFRQATHGDARVTRIGNILRRTSIDELPQLLNVLLGDMSLIGPRPHPLALDEQYKPLVDDYMRRYSVRPGMSGLAQVSGHRGPTPTADAMAERVELDLAYIDSWSFGLDIRILLRTVLPWWREVRHGD